MAIRPSRARLRLVKSANGAYRKAVFEQVGGFDPAMEWDGDAALTFKVDESGWKTVHSRDIKVVHAEKIWPVKKAFLYGTCYFPLRKKYPHHKAVRGLLIPPMIMGPVVTLGVIADLLSRLPVFTLSLVTLLSILNGVASNGCRRRIPMDGFYTTVWCLSYYSGAIYGAARDALLDGVGYFRRLWIRAQNLDKDRLAS